MPDRLPLRAWLTPMLAAVLGACHSQALGVLLVTDAGAGGITGQAPDAAPPLSPDGPPLVYDAVPIDAGLMPDSGLGAGGTPDGPGVPSCVPGTSVVCACANGRSGAQVCNAGGAFDPCQCTESASLQVYKRAIVGKWAGLVETPWRAPYKVTMTFTADGHYAAHCLEPDCVALYYGADDDTPEKVYELQDVRADGAAHGEIAIWFMPGDTNRGELRSLRLAEEAMLVSFEVWKQDYGPVTFTLRREP
jgi:hypothetical protein